MVRTPNVKYKRYYYFTFSVAVLAIFSLLTLKAEMWGGGLSSEDRVFVFRSI